MISDLLVVALGEILSLRSIYKQDQEEDKQANEQRQERKSDINKAPLKKLFQPVITTKYS